MAKVSQAQLEKEFRQLEAEFFGVSQSRSGRLSRDTAQVPEEPEESVANILGISVEQARRALASDAVRPSPKGVTDDAGEQASSPTTAADAEKST